MEMSFTVSLPHDEASIPVVRHVCRSALNNLGVTHACAADIELAVTEACTNVLKHARGSTDAYTVRIGLHGDVCDIEVVDEGGAFESERLDGRQAPHDAESGRGIHLMRALVDNLQFVARSGSGMSVHLTKTLELNDGALLRRLGPLAAH